MLLFSACLFFYYDAYSKSSGNRKVIKTIVINKNAHGSATVDRSFFSDIKAYLCEETHTIEIDFFDVCEGDIYIIDSNSEIVAYDTITSSHQVLDVSIYKGNYSLIIDSPTLYAEGLFCVD